jgi:hypothetical protein
MSLAPVPELRDDFISFELDFPGESVHEDLCFYVLTPERYQLDGNQVSSVTVQFDKEDPNLYAASTGNQVYLLHGFGSSALNFNRLMVDLHIEVNSPERAISVFNFYSKVVYGGIFRSKIVGDDLQLIAVAAEDFRLRYSSANRYREFRKWMSSEEYLRKGVRPPQARKVKDRYEIKYVYYEEGRLHPVTIVVGPNGEVSDR